MIRYFCVRAPLCLTLSTLFFIHNKTAFIFTRCVDRFLRSIAACDSNEIRFKEKSIFFDNFRNGTPSKNNCRMNSTIKNIETDFSGWRFASVFNIKKFDPDLCKVYEWAKLYIWSDLHYHWPICHFLQEEVFRKMLIPSVAFGITWWLDFWNSRYFLSKILNLDPKFGLSQINPISK